MDAHPQAASDAELLRLAQRDPAAFGELYRRHAEALHSWFAQRLAWAAADLTAETFARAWLARRRFRDDRDGSARPWLLGIARNVLRDSVRRDRVETKARERLGLPLQLAPDAAFGDVEERLSPRPELATALAGLSGPERQAVELRVVDELPYDQVASRLGIRPAAARLRVSRALRRLATDVPQEER
jgi:RNA polymerase sigma-70 factor (ECF subfamily)